jgi:hypothetical protein
MELVTIFRTFSSAEAELVRSRLEAADFTVELIQPDLSALNLEGYSMTTGGIQVQVPADQAEDARRLLASAESSSE